MRNLLAFLIVIGSIASLAFDTLNLCGSGVPGTQSMCRPEQFPQSAKSSITGSITTGFRMSLVAVPVDLGRWVDYADALSGDGWQRASDMARQHIKPYSTGSAPILMRLGNNYLMTGDYVEYLSYMKRVLSLTSSYNGAIFSSFASIADSDLGMNVILEHALPVDRQVAANLLSYYSASSASIESLSALWAWMRNHNLASEREAGEAAFAFVRGGEFQKAHDAWMAFVSQKERNELLGNGTFFRVPIRSPFDWQITPQDGVTFQRDNGLTVRFHGSTNLRMANVRQCALLTSGQYLLSADVESRELTTDQRPAFEVVDAQSPMQLLAATPMVEPSASEAALEAPFEVSRPTGYVCVQLVREPSERNENRIAGTLHIRSVRIRTLSARTDTSASAGEAAAADPSPGARR